MMEVYLFAGSHPIYKSLIKYPPGNIVLKSNISVKGFSGMGIYNSSQRLKKKFYRTFRNVFNMPRKIWLPKRADLIHSTRGFLIMNRTPWILELEHVNYLDGSMRWGRPYKEPVKSKIEKMLSSNYCKKILPFSKASKKSFEYIFGDKYSDKLEVLYPAIKKRKDKVTEPDYPIRILFIGEFLMKGGKELVDVADKLEFDYQLDLKVTRGEIPEEYKEKIENNDRINLIKEIVPREKLFSKYYDQADIFALPTYMDNFGYVILEAMTSGLPVISTKHFAVPEMVKHGKNGYLVEPLYTTFDEKLQHKSNPPDLLNMNNKRFVKGLAKRINKLGKNPKKIKKMGNKSLDLIEEKFEIKVRNRKLEEIYEKCLENR